MRKFTRFVILLARLAAAAVQAQTVTSFQAGDGGWQLASPAVGNIDADAAQEVVLAYRNSNGQWLLDAYKASGARVSGFPYSAGSQPINVSPTLADLDGDGRNEIIFTAGASVVALRGTGAVFWRHEVNRSNYVPDAGFMAATNGFYLSAAGILEPLLPITAEFSSEVSPPIVVDLEGDGSLEVVTAWKINPDKLGLLQDFNPFVNDVFGLGEWGATGEVWSGGVIVSDARTGVRKFTYHFHQLVEAGLAIGQLDQDAAREVLVLNDADSVVAFDMTQPPGYFGKGMLHKKFGKNLRLLSGSYQTGVDVQLADIDGDGLDEVLVASTQINPNWQPNESILDDDGALMWRSFRPVISTPNVHGWFNSAVLIPVNPDGDNKVDVLGFTHSHEITFRTWNGIELANRAGWPKSFAPHFPSPPVVGDVDGDGVEEIVIATYDPARNPSSGKLFVFALDGTQKHAIDIAGGVKHIPAIADLDGDGRTEVILRSLAGRVHIVKFGAGGTGKVSWAMHRGNASRDRRGGLYPAGTPLVTSKAGAYRRGSFRWQVPAGFQPSGFRIVRADRPGGAFAELATLGAEARSFTSYNLALGRQYIFEVHALYASGAVASAPFAIRSDLNGNLIVNGGFEEDDDSHWDKWFTGSVSWTNMVGSSSNPRSGDRSLELRLRGNGSASTITQYSHYGVPEDYLPVTAGVLYSFGGFVRTEGLDQATEQWFEWDSSRTAENPNPRPALPWPNYFTPSLKAPVGSSGWTYLNRVFEMPSGFSNVELRHRYRSPAAATGSVFLDDIFFRALPGPNEPQWQHWIGFNSQWRYWSSTPPANWFSASFDDSAWPLGTAKFGQGGGPQNIVTPLPKNQPAYYFRKEFHASAGAHELLLAAICTDDYGGKVYPMRVWLNGVEIPAGGIESVTGEGNAVRYFDLAPFVDYLSPGWNSIAVMLNNTWASTWDNVAFDVSLRAIPQPTGNNNAVAAIEQISRAPNGALNLRVSADRPSSWRVEAASRIGTAWQTIGRIDVSASGSATVQLNTPAQTTQFFRLAPE